MLKSSVLTTSSWSLSPCFPQALLAGQGLDPHDFLFTERDYRAYNKMAGNCCTTSVLGAAVTAILLGVLYKREDGQRHGWNMHQARSLNCVLIVLMVLIVIVVTVIECHWKRLTFEQKTIEFHSLVFLFVHWFVAWGDFLGSQSCEALPFSCINAPCSTWHPRARCNSVECFQSHMGHPLQCCVGFSQ